jgi:glycosyltransferase domain-containing protein
MITPELSNQNYAVRPTVKGASSGIDVTLVMPTRHRLNFVRAYLTFLAMSNFGGHLVIADGSDDSSEIALRAHFENLCPAFRLTVVEVPKERGDCVWTNMNKCIHKAGQCIDTSYACLCFDDDFIIPSFLDKAMQMLDADQKIGFVVGAQLALELTTRNRPIPWPFRAHNVGNIRSIAAIQPVSRMADFFASPYQLAYAVVRAPTFVQYVPSDHQQYFFASLSSDYSWYCAVLASGLGVAVQECGILRLFHDSNTKTYGQGAVEVYQALLDGRIAADAERLERRIEDFAKISGNNGEVDDGMKQLVFSVALVIMSSLMATPNRLMSKARPLSWLSSVAFRLKSKASSLVAGTRNYKAISLLDEILRIHGF